MNMEEVCHRLQLPGRGNKCKQGTGQTGCIKKVSYYRRRLYGIEKTYKHIYAAEMQGEHTVVPLICDDECSIADDLKNKENCADGKKHNFALFGAELAVDHKTEDPDKSRNCEPGQMNGIKKIESQIIVAVCSLE